MSTDANLLKTIDLGLRELHLGHKLERYLRHKKFPRICVTDQSITMGGSNYNLETGYCWDFVVAGLAGKKLEYQIDHVEHLPFSNQQLAFGTLHDQSYLLMKSSPSSRRLCTVDRRRRDVLYLEMIAKGLLMMNMKGDREEYWSLMDIFGNVLPLPDELQSEAFKQGKWSKVEARQLRVKKLDKA